MTSVAVHLEGRAIRDDLAPCRLADLLLAISTLASISRRRASTTASIFLRSALTMADSLLLEPVVRPAPDLLPRAIIEL
jgi:hypothetical protein